MRDVVPALRALREAGEAKTKIGHGGTLDPLASGVLPIALGEATKLAGRMLGSADLESCWEIVLYADASAIAARSWNQVLSHIACANTSSNDPLLMSSRSAPTVLSATTFPR